MPGYSIDFLNFRVVQSTDWYWGPKKQFNQPKYVQDAALATMILCIIGLIVYIIYSVSLLLLILKGFDFSYEDWKEHYLQIIALTLEWKGRGGGALTVSWKNLPPSPPPESAAIYLLKFSNGNTRIIFEICFNLTTKTVDRRHWYCSGVFIVNFEQTSHIFWCFPCCHFLVFPLFPYFPIYLLFRLAINRLESNEK